MVGLEAEQRVDVQARDRRRRLRCDLLDVHAAARREHHERRLRGAVEDERCVVLGGDLRGCLDPHLVHGQAADVHPEDCAGVGACLIRVCGDLDPAELAAAPDLDLCLHRARVADRVGRAHRVIDACRDFSFRYRYAMAR